MGPLFLIAAAVIVFDRLTKIWVLNTLGGPTGAYIQPIIPGWLELRYTQNTGAAFSILQGGSWILAVIAAVVCAAIIYAAPRIRQDSANARIGLYGLIGLALVLGGALGNLIDRILYGYVVDFVNFYGVGINFNDRRYQWGIFNGADSAITIGIVILLISLLIGNKESKPNT